MQGANIAIWGWDSSNNAWVKALVDSSGHLQVDTVTTALPTGAATSAKQDTIIGHVDGIETLLAGGLPAALDIGALKVKEQSPITGFATSAKQDTIIGHIDGIETLLGAGLPVALDTLSLKVREQGTPSVHLYGYDGSAWQTLLTESDTLKNLRVRLYSGATAIDTVDVDTHMSTQHGLCVAAGVQGWDAANQLRAIKARFPNADARGTSDYSLTMVSWLYGFNGSSFDRVRVSAAMSMMTKAETSYPTSSGLLTSTTQVSSNPTHVYGITINKNSTAVGAVQLRDGIGAGGTPLWELRITGTLPFSKNFYPWLGFDAGLYLSISGNIHSVIIEYGDET